MRPAPEDAQLAVRRMARALGQNGLSGPFGHCSVRLDDERVVLEWQKVAFTRLKPGESLLQAAAE